MRLPTFCRHFLSRVQVIKIISGGSDDKQRKEILNTYFTDSAELNFK